MNSKKNIIFIHGWGLSSKIFEPIVNLLGNDYEIYSLDLPGFGKTPIEKKMTLKDYAEFVYEFLKKNQIKDSIIIGHSFGGAVAAKFSLLYPNEISKLILVSASAIRQSRLKMVLVKKAADFLKPLLPEKLRKFVLKLLKLDQTDYAQIESPELKETFKNIIAEDLKHDLSLIKSPTLIIWGENDAVTPLTEGELIATSIPGAKFEIIKNAGHFIFLEKPEEFIELIKEFSL